MVHCTSPESPEKTIGLKHIRWDEFSSIPILNWYLHPNLFFARKIPSQLFVLSSCSENSFAAVRALVTRDDIDNGRQIKRLNHIKGTFDSVVLRT